MFTLPDITIADCCGCLPRILSKEETLGGIVDSIVLGQAAGVEHVSFHSRTELLIFPYNEP